MAAIILPRRNFNRPLGRLALANEFSSPDAFLFDGGHYNPVAFYRGGNGGIGATPSGAGTLFDDGIRQSADFIDAAKTVTSDFARYTSVSVVFSTGTDGSYSNIFNIFGILQLRHTAANWDLYHNDGGFKLARWSSGHTLNTVQVLVATYDGTTARLFSNNKIVASNTMGVLRSRLENTILVGRDSFINSNTYWKGAILTTALFPFNVGQVRALDLTLNPWQIFRADPVRIYSLAAATIPTLSAPGVTDITATSARPQVTLTY